MRADKIKRFSAWQIVLHWAQAIPYVLLLCSGALMLGQRFLDVLLIPHDKLAAVHRGAGLTLISLLLVILVVSCLSGNFSQIGGDIAHCFLWRRNDFLWLGKVAFNALWPRVNLPAAGRFNAGQKLHGAFVVLAVPLFALTGLSMIYIPSALGPWVVHVLLFLVAAGFLAVHLFLALINPPTRRALGGIFSGYVSRHYADSHHPLWTGAKEKSEHSSVVSGRVLPVVSFCGALLAAAGVWSYGPERLGRRLARWGQAQLMEAINPGVLAASHADDSRIDGCLSCHRWFEATMTSACVSCHMEIEEVLADNRGYHGKLSQACASCHADHEGYDADIRHLDSKGFDHQQARFDLKGKHMVVQCSKCHFLNKQGTSAQQQRYIGVNFESCLVCHANPHRSSKADDCTRCHDEQGWKQETLLFVHNRDCEFAIDQIHAQLTCKSCHGDMESALFDPLPTTCSQCHADIQMFISGIAGRTIAEPSPHAQRVKCVQCHLTNKPKQEAYDYAAVCSACHNKHYRELYYDWGKAFSLRQSGVDKLLKKVSSENAFQASELVKAMKQVKAVGFHNILLARKLWDEILSKDSKSLCSQSEDAENKVK